MTTITTMPIAPLTRAINHKSRVVHILDGTKVRGLSDGARAIGISNRVTKCGEHHMYLQEYAWKFVSEARAEVLINAHTHRPCQRCLR